MRCPVPSDAHIHRDTFPHVADDVRTVVDAGWRVFTGVGRGTGVNELERSYSLETHFRRSNAIPPDLARFCPIKIVKNTKK